MNSVEDIIKTAVARVEKDPNMQESWDVTKQYLEDPAVINELQKLTDVDLKYALNGLTEKEVQNLFYDVMKQYINPKKFAEGGQFDEEIKMVDIKIGKNKYNVAVARNEKQKERGLMGVTEMNPDEGMLFDYRRDPQDELEFWMKDTPLPLDIIFVNDDGEVIQVSQGEPNTEDLIECKPEDDEIAAVIELNINSGVEIGNKVNLLDYGSFDDEYPELKPNKLYVIGSDGIPQAELEGGERIISRKQTLIVLRKAKRAYKSKSDNDYLSLGKYILKVFDGQDNREPEYVNK